MSLFTNRAFLSTWQATIQFVRFRRHIVKPHYERAKVLGVCKPIYEDPSELLSLAEQCPNREKTQGKQIEDDPYIRLLAKEILNKFNQFPMVMFYHANSIKADEYFKAQVFFHKEDMTLKRYGRGLLHPALEGTKFETVLPLFKSSSCIVFSPEIQVNKILKISKKITQLILLAGIVEGQLLSKQGIIEYSRLPSLQMARAQLTSTFNSAASQLVNNLTYHQSTLIRHLDQHIDIQNSKLTPSS